MQFKHPEILYFLLLLIVPILVHLFQLRRFRKEYFTNVRFLKILSIESRKSSKIKKWLLLGCRMLLLSCLILAFAQPFFKASNAIDAQNEMYIILDNSFSMQAKGKKGELLKRAVQQLLEETPQNANFSLLTTSDAYWNTDIKSIRPDLQKLGYSATPFDLGALMTKINAHKSAVKKDIIIITDAVGLTQEQLKNIEKEQTVYFIVPKAEQNNNIAIDSVYISQTLDDFYQLSIKTRNYGQSSQLVPLALYNGNKLLAKTIIDHKNKIELSNFTIPKQAFHGYLSIEDKDLSYDNQLFFSISQRKKTNVISIGTPEKNNFLSRIYTSDEFNYSSSPLPSLDYNLIDKQDAIVLNELDEIPLALQTTLKVFVSKGGNLIIIPSSEGSITNLNDLLKPFSSASFLGLESNEKLVSKINFSHPLFSGVFESKTNNFQYPKVKQSFGVSKAGPTVLSFEDQSVFLIGQKNSLSSVYIFTAAINSANSNFQQSPLIVPVFYKMALSNQNNGINSHTIGHNSTQLLTVQISKDEILKLKNKEEEFIPLQKFLHNKVQLYFELLPEKAGNFTVYNKQNPIEHISFNYPRTESDLDQVKLSHLEAYQNQETISSIFDTLQSSRSDHQIWKWFIIFALLFMVLEMAIIKFIK